MLKTQSMKLKGKSRDDMRRWIKEKGYEEVVPYDFWNTPHSIFYVGTRENPTVQQKHVIISVEKRQATTFNTESYYFIKEKRLVKQETWKDDELVGSYL